MRLHRSHHSVLLLALIVAAGTLTILAPRDVPASASGQQDAPPPVMPTSINITDIEKDGKLVGPLASVAASDDPSDATSGGLAPVVQAAGGVVVLVDTTGDARAAAAELSARGMHVGEVSQELNIVQGRIPAALLDDLAALPSVARIRLPERPVLNATTEGDAILDANDLRTTYAANGAGVRVGVISDGLEGLAAAQGAGELPAVNSTTCDAVAFAPAGQPANPTDPGAGAEGTAMLEIVHDMAPGAELWFGYFGFNVTTGTTLDYMQAVDCLAANVDVIVDNVTYMNNGLYDGTSAVSQDIAAELNAPGNRVRGYYNAVGSVARQHYQELYVDSGFTITAGTNVWNIHRFQATASTTDGGQGAQCAANPAFGYCGDRVFLPPGEILRVGLQWDDPWGASANDYDLFLLNENTSNFFLINPNEQNGNDNPVEEFAWQNTTGATQPLSIFIGRFSGVPKTFDMFVLCEDCTPIAGNQHNFNTLSSSVMNNADAGGGVMALGAINADDPGNDDIAPYSSRGPTNDLRTKPDATAIDEVTVSGAGGFDVPFVGTSAAAPHGGAIAALLLSCQPSLKHGEPGDNPAADRTSLRNAAHEQRRRSRYAGRGQHVRRRTARCRRRRGRRRMRPRRGRRRRVAARRQLSERRQPRPGEHRPELHRQQPAVREQRRRQDAGELRRRGRRLRHRRRQRRPHRRRRSVRRRLRSLDDQRHIARHRRRPLPRWRGVCARLESVERRVLSVDHRMRDGGGS